jgi:hypothetical protein
MICLDTPDGDKVCFAIPVLIRKFPIGPDPDPGPWIVDRRLDQQVIQDLEAVATIDQVRTQASPRVNEVMQDALQRVTADVALPAGMSLQQHQRG